MSLDKITKKGWVIGANAWYSRMDEDTKEIVTFVTQEENEKYNLDGHKMNDGTFLVYFKEDELKNWMRSRLIDEML